MKNLIKTIIASTLLLTAASSFAADTKTDMASHWMCTTNASSSDVTEEKVMDETMADKTVAKTQSASKAFSNAAEHCRDCTKITCETVSD